MKLAERCRTMNGNLRCELSIGHDGPHTALRGKMRIRWAVVTKAPTAMSDAVVDVFADAFEEDPIRLAIAAYRKELAKQVRALPEGKATPERFVLLERRAVLALIAKETP